MANFAHGHYARHPGRRGFAGLFVTVTSAAASAAARGNLRREGVQHGIKRCHLLADAGLVRPGIRIEGPCPIEQRVPLLGRPGLPCDALADLAETRANAGSRR